IYLTSLTVATPVSLTSTTVFDAFLPKATKMASGRLFCCLWLGDSRWELRQRQLKRLPTCFFAASAEDPMKPTKVKGSNHASGGKILLPLPKIQ
ncbi:MAG: hypothetical protein VZR28_12930, partial [Candidatus Cryptobacteroides sp.]|nr:hypothetical protein [Candidatus Cryptobacteroides sp.]